jgi:hypothetical protein
MELMADSTLHNGHQDTCPLGDYLNEEDLHDDRTLCLVCRSDGNEAALAGPTVQPKATQPHNVESVQMYATQLGLGQWTLRLGEVFDSSYEEDAYVRVEHRELVATVFIDPRANDEQWERLLVHELLHLVLYDLQRLAMNDETIPMMDLVDLELERVINNLTNAIAGIPWEPIREVTRKLHEFDLDDE